MKQHTSKILLASAFFLNSHQPGTISYLSSNATHFKGNYRKTAGSEGLKFTLYFCVMSL